MANFTGTWRCVIWRAWMGRWFARANSGGSDWPSRGDNDFAISPCLAILVVTLLPESPLTFCRPISAPCRPVGALNLSVHRAVVNITFSSKNRHGHLFQNHSLRTAFSNCRATEHSGMDRTGYSVSKRDCDLCARSRPRHLRGIDHSLG